jgi:flagellar basal body rod protein FlgG
MNIGLYQSASSLSALERWQEVTAQNITASHVTGYRKRTVEFSGISLGEVQTDPGKGKIGQGAGPQSIFPKATYGINFENGENLPTQRPLDLAIEGAGYFQLKLPDGSMAYTRDGAFRITPDRKLVGSNGYEVLTKDGEAITLLPEGGELAIGMDGTLSQGATQLGKIGIHTFAKNQDLTAVSGGIFVAKAGVDPIAVEKPTVMQGHLEGSNVAPLREMIALVQIARAYEANQKIITTQDQTLARALETLG